MANMNKIKEIFNNPADMEELNKCTTVEASLAFLNDKGAEMTVEEIKELAAAIAKAAKANEEAMNLDEMENVAGGGIFGDIFGGIANVARAPLKWGTNLTYNIVESVIDIFA